MILKTATDKTNFTRTLHFAHNARTAWGHLLKNLYKQGKSGVLLPSYIGITDKEGSGVFDPIEESNAKFAFYRVNDTLQPDFVHIEELLKSGEFHVVLVIHYFGFCRSNLKQIKQLCEKYGVLLVEDCAHAFHLELEHPVLGVTGDYSFYSLHKYFATDSGGILQVNNHQISIPTLDTEKKASVDVLEQYIKTDFRKVAQTRINNAKLYSELLPRHEEITLLYDIQASDIPQTFPLRIKNSKREKLYFYLMEREIPTVALYYRMISEISKDEFPLSYQIAGEILNLPVHQDTTPEDVKIICNAIADFFNQK